MNNQQTTERTIIDEVVENLIKRTELLEKEQLVKNEALFAKENETQVLLAAFEDRFGNITIEASKPDMSVVRDELHKGLAGINETLEKWSRPLKKEYHFSLFPEQLRSVEYVRAVLTRVILGVISLVFLIFTYLLMDKHIQ
ncbi:hypothetical protein [Pedobacter cryoconitis]|uniref:hypothetical protein n=1 Tax=Pedobacter cryoconitis TaxID=188932 RepID=UPI00161E7795|nr:hypothetical protein [Pedobacter cryoconitis]MBB5646987.1 hypothetical protein [Pedobacter cryoconitis]